MQTYALRTVGRKTFLRSGTRSELHKEADRLNAKLKWLGFSTRVEVVSY